MIKHLPGAEILHTQLSNDEHNRVVSILDSYIKDESNYIIPAYPDWTSQATFTSRHNSNIPWHDVIDIFMPYMNNYLDSIQVRNKQDIRVEGWLNKYKKHTYQGLHDHHSSALNIDVLFSCVYIYSNPKDENRGKIRFENPVHKRWGSLAKYIPKDNIVFIELEQDTGTFIIFPSWLEHWVTPHAVDEERITLTFNLLVEHN